MAMENVFYLIGPLMLIAGVLLFIKKRKFKKESLVIDGEVIEIRTGRDSKNRTVYYPVIRYFDRAASLNEVYESNTAYESTKFRIGDKVELRYLNDGIKKQVCMNNWFGIWGLSTMLMLFGLIFCAIDFVLLFIKK